MPCYILAAGDTSMTKIGWAASDVAERMRNLQAGCWEPLRVLRTIPGDRRTEGWLHRRFAEHRVSREWFRFHQDMLTVEPPITPIRIKPPCKMPQERRDQISAALRKSWREGRARETFMLQHPELQSAH